MPYSFLDNVSCGAGWTSCLLVTLVSLNYSLGYPAMVNEIYTCASLLNEGPFRDILQDFRFWGLIGGGPHELEMRFHET